jgi:dienelactone hydrolase
MREFFNVLLSTISLLTIFPLSMCDAVNTAAVSFAPAGPADTPGAVIPKAIPAKLSLPSGATGRVPAVVIAHAGSGLTAEGPEPAYVAALNAAGIGTLTIDMWTPRGVPSGPAALGGDGAVDRRPQSVRDTLPDAFGALKYLAGHPAIDPKRIGIMGFSWGAMLSVLAMEELAAERALGAGPRFAAHAGHYLVCSFFLPEKTFAPVMTAKWTVAPLQLQVGGQDDYDGADGGASCRRLVDDLPPDKRTRIDLIVHPEATHAWEEKIPIPISFHDPRSRTGNVRVIPDAEASSRARTTTVAFFKKVFGL